jgi:hypothetical protein
VSNPGWFQACALLSALCEPEFGSRAPPVSVHALGLLVWRECRKRQARGPFAQIKISASLGLNEGFIVLIGSGAVHPPRDAVFFHRACGRGLQDFEAAFAGEPLLDLVLLEDHRHPVMDVRDFLAGIADDDGGGGDDFAARRVGPFFIEPGEREHFAVHAPEVMRLAPAVFAFAPFVISRGRDDAAAGFERAAKHRLLGYRVRARVEGGGEFLERLLPPRRNEAPARGDDFRAAIPRADDVDRRRRADVVAGLEIGAGSARGVYAIRAIRRSGIDRKLIERMKLRPCVHLGEASAHERMLAARVNTD